MYSTAVLVLYRNLGSEGWLRHHSQKQDVIPLERLLLFEYVKADLYERQLKLGMLSPHATLYYPTIDNLSRETHTMEKGKDEQSTNESSIQKGQTKNKDTIKEKQNIPV